ncbi:hypothetical protein [cf. Phormidesmis sp. LEGE 11477]|uniref:hypothetical protein n=1 Tax=cf. Phormidesmis sp. LEGE 11477 TaxID=1828680 RepID=UPI0018819D17|nr:hypothetical protein [cf. Phormidesmis sp. LEGE 11477]MBE9064524.1 hypothetical protein [cf. Phormidesmis sp. LEGE 11477]
MAQNDIVQKGGEILSQVTSAVEEAGKEVVSQVSNLTEAQPKEAAEKATEEAIQAAVDQALDVLQIAGDQVREKGINTECVTLKASVGIPNVAQLEVSTDVPSKRESTKGKGFEVKVS